MLVQKEIHNSRRDSMSYPAIPDAELFQNQSYGYEKPASVEGWQWSTTFQRWSAMVVFENGWRGFTYPKAQ